MKSKIILLTSIFGLAGLFAIFIALKLFITGEGFYECQTMLVPNTDNIFLKYIVGFMFLSLSIPVLAMATLPYTGTLSLDYYNEPKHIQAKNDVILSTLGIPTFIVMVIWLNHSGFENSKIKVLTFIAATLFILNYISGIVTLVKHKNNTT